MTNANNPAAGWYPDPQSPMQQRYWDGANWTEQTRPVMPVTAASPVPPPPSGFAATGFSPAGMLNQKPNNYLVWSILSTVCCCIPVGIAAIVNAARVDGAWSRGDYAGAQKYSADAKKFTIIAAVLGGVVNFGIVAVQLLAAVATA
jgi:hypothetical protein